MSEQRKQISKLAAALVEYQDNFGSMSTADRQWAIQNTKEAIGLFAKAVKNRDVQMLATVVRIDRSTRPAYPDWAAEVLHPELELTGPAEYTLGSLEQWLHDGQKNGSWRKGEVIYEHLESNNMLEGCLGLADLLAIQELGIKAFRRYFAGKAVFGWKSVVRDRDGGLLGPCLVERDGEVVLGWFWLGGGWGSGAPALRFAS